MTEQQEHTVIVNPMAMDEIKNMAKQVEACAEVWGKRGEAQFTDAALKMATSLSTSLARVMTAGFGPKTEVARDGDLSLYLVTGIHIGVIFFRKDRPDFAKEGDLNVFSQWAPIMGRYCMAPLTPKELEDAGRPVFTNRDQFCLQPYTLDKHTCEHTGHPMALPVLGEWSLHS